MTEYRTGLPAPQVHDALKKALIDLRRAERQAVLWFGEIAKRRLYRELGYATIHLYAEKALGFSRSKTYQFLRLADDLERLPVLKEAVANGSVSWTKARAVAVVADRSNETAWVERAQCSTVQALRQDISQARVQRCQNPSQGELIPNESHLPETADMIRVNLRLHPTEAAQWEGLFESLRKKGLHGSRAEIMLTALDLMASQKSTRVHSDNHSQIVIHKCPKCGKATVQTNQGIRHISKAELAAAECDSVIVTPGRPNRHTIPPSVRREVLMRDNFRCQTVGCHNTRFLEVHHKKPRADGGANTTDNLITLCSACHRQAHR